MGSRPSRELCKHIYRLVQKEKIALADTNPVKQKTYPPVEAVDKLSSSRTPLYSFYKSPKKSVRRASPNPDISLSLSET